MTAFILMLVGWIVFSIAVAKRAKNRNRDFGGWLILSLLFSPLAGALLVFILPPLPPREPRRIVPENPEARAARLKRQDRQAIIGSAIAVGLILGLFVFFWLIA